MNANTEKLLEELKRLAKRSGAALFKRIQIARQLMDDNDWIEESHGSDWFAAHDYLQNEFFGDVMLGARTNGKVTLQVLFNVYDKWPRKADWEKYQYNLLAMIAIMRKESDPEDDGRETKKRLSWKKLYTEVEEENEKLRMRIESLEAENKELKEENRKLASDYREIEERLAELKGELRGLRSPVGTAD